MTFPINIPPLRSYYDPSLWTRLEPLIRAEMSAKTQHLVDAKWKTIEEARQLIGYIRALEWVLGSAADDTRVDEGQRQLE